MRRLLLMIPLLTLLAGCADSTVTGEWSCPASQPDGCLSVADGDRLALANLTAPPPSVAILQGPDQQHIAPATSPSRQTVSEGKSDSVSGTLEAQRIPEELSRVWIGGFVDRAGNYHPPSEVWIVIRPAEWRRP